MDTSAPRTALPPAIIAGPGVPEYEGKGWGAVHVWTDYPLTIEARGRSYRVATLTEYPNGRVLILKDAMIRTAAAHAAWFNLVRAIGETPEIGKVMYAADLSDAA